MTNSVEFILPIIRGQVRFVRIKKNHLDTDKNLNYPKSDKR